MQITVTKKNKKKNVAKPNQHDGVFSSVYIPQDSKGVFLGREEIILANNTNGAWDWMSYGKS